MKVDINTKMITLIGTPLGQSFAARMQNAGFEAAGENMIYFFLETGKENLGEIVAGLRHMNLAGLGVTKPDKVAILPYLDELDPTCQDMGACNTVVKTADGRLVGYNTDGIGFYTSLTEEGGIQAEGNTFFCFGAGGAGRAMCSVLAQKGARKIYVTDLYEESCRALVEDINKKFAPVAQAVPHGDFSVLRDCTVVMNASGVGMGSSMGQTPLPKEYMDPGQFFFDACYNPERTQFLLDAQSIGARVLNGLGMVLYQGAAQVKLWTGKEARIDAMRRELEKIVLDKGA